MKFEYLKRTVSDDAIEIADIGNCALHAFGDMGDEYVLVIRTVLGMSEIFFSGPFVPQDSKPPLDFECTYTRLPFSEKAIKKKINNFLNGYFKITQVFEINATEAKNYFINIGDWL